MWRSSVVDAPGLGLISRPGNLVGQTLEYQAMPSLRYVAHDGVLCTFSKGSAPQTGASGVVRQGRRHGDRLLHTKLHPVGPLSSSQPGGTPCRAVGDEHFLGGVL